MTPQEAFAFLDSFQNYEKLPTFQYPEAFSLERMEKFLERLGNPHKKYPVLHVAGTKGKGSSCAFAAEILKKAGARVGLYTSPHLVYFRERIRLDGHLVSEEALADLVEQIKPVVSSDLTYFEVTTACAFLYFARAKVNAAVIEVGLGGRLDATNVVEPSVTAVTPISLDHVQLLGGTLGTIAHEKAGILKLKIPVVLAPQSSEALRVLRTKALMLDAPCHIVEEEVHIEEKMISAQGSRVSLRTPIQSYSNLFIPLAGRHQLTNAAVAVRMVELFLHRLGRNPLPPAIVQEGIAQTVWQGRCQLIEGTPPILLDGAHNGASALILKETVDELFPGRQVTLVVGISREKEISEMASIFGSWTEKIFLTRAKNPRAESPEKLAEIFQRWHSHPMVVQSTAEALERARQVTAPDGLIVVTGSLFIVGEALQFLGLKLS